MTKSPLLEELEQELDWRRVEFHACRDGLKKEQEAHKSVQKDLEFERNSNKRLLERVMQTEAKLEYERNANRALLRRIAEPTTNLLTSFGSDAEIIQQQFRENGKLVK